MGRVATGCVHGRFQVFHNDHLEYVRAASAHCDQLVVGITSPDLTDLTVEATDEARSNRFNNPLTYFERMEMIYRVLGEAGEDPRQTRVVPFPIEAPERLRSYVPADAVHFMTIYDEWGLEKERRLISLGFPVEVLWRSEEKGIAGRRLRRAMADGNPWEDEVPLATATYLRSIDLVSRLRALR